MLDIDNLRLTPKEYKATLQQELPAGFSYFSPRIIADAQLEKALWGVQAWLDTMSPANGRVERTAENVLCQLKATLQAAGMTRPEGE